MRDGLRYSHFYIKVSSAGRFGFWVVIRYSENALRLCQNALRLSTRALRSRTNAVRRALRPRADVTAQASDGAESASDEIEADSIGKKATIRKSLTQKPPDRMTTQKGNRSADGTSIVEKGVRRLSAATGQ